MNLTEIVGQAMRSLVGTERDPVTIAEMCEHTASRHQHCLIRHPDGTPYLSRYYLHGGPKQRNAFDRSGKPRRGITWHDTPYGLYLHRFHTSDQRGATHNHPWANAASLILTGGYHETRLTEHGLTTTTIQPFDTTTLTRSTYHRVELLEHEAWTLFAVGRFVGQWTFTPDPQPATSRNW